jgi:proprotein convertase subtilisin/kexin type 5
VITFTCINCSTNSIPNSQKTACVCLPGYTANIQGGCGPTTSTCPSNQILSGNKCICIPGYAFNAYGVCTTCPLGSQPSSDQSTCTCTSSSQYFNQTSFACFQCPPNSHADQSNCLCNSGYVVINGSCVPSSQTCQSNQILSGNKCICLPGYAFNAYGVCTICPLGSQPTFDQSTCTCTSTTQYFNQTSFACFLCPSNSHANQSNCLCNSGYVVINGSCVPSSQTCQPN